MSQAKHQIKESGKPALNRIEITTRDDSNQDKLCKQIEELNKRVARLEGIVKKLEASNENPKENPKSTGVSTNRSFSKQKSLNIQLVDINLPEKDKIPKSVQINKDLKASSSSKSPPMATTVYAAPTHNRKPQVQTSVQVEPFMSRRNLASVAQTSSVQNGKGATDIPSLNEASAVKNFAKQYEELSRPQTNLSRRKSQSVTDVVTLQFDKRKSTPESKKLQLSLAPQTKDLLSSSLNAQSAATNEVKSRSEVKANSEVKLRSEVKSNSEVKLRSEVKSNSEVKLRSEVKSNSEVKLRSEVKSNSEVAHNINSPTSPQAPLTPKLSSRVNEPPAAPPLPKEEIPTKSQRRNSEMSVLSNEDFIGTQPRKIKGLANADGSYDALMDQLKQFADSGFPFKRQVPKKTNRKSHTLNIPAK